MGTWDVVALASGLLASILMGGAMLTGAYLLVAPMRSADARVLAMLSFEVGSVLMLTALLLGWRPSRILQRGVE